jgi:hypothetical protein
MQRSRHEFETASHVIARVSMPLDPVHDFDESKRPNQGNKGAKQAEGA